MKEIEIPEGYEARIEGNKVVIEPKESEDERIRTRLIALVEAFGQGTYKDEMLAYLEKQKEQEFTHHEVGESLEEAVTHQMEDDGDVDDFVRKGLDDVVLKYAKLGAEWQKEQKPAEWSEEDETHLGWIIECFDSWKYQVPEFADQYQSAIAWLKSLRPQPHWKPSEEQLKALQMVKDSHYFMYRQDRVAIETLLKQLKSL